MEEDAPDGGNAAFVDVDPHEADEELLKSVAAALGLNGVAELRSMLPADLRGAVAHRRRRDRTWASAGRALLASAVLQALRASLPAALQLALAALALRAPARVFMACGAAWRQQQ